jgi:putative DNA primase/helicase
MGSRELLDLCRGDWPQVLSQLAPSAELQAAVDRGPRRHGFCPNPGHRGVHGDAFRIFDDFDETGGAICNSCGAFPNGVALMMWLNGWRFEEAALAIEEFHGIAKGARAIERTRIQRDPQSKPKPHAPAQRSGPTRADLQTLWDASYPIEHADAAPLVRYLHARGLNGIEALGPNLRCHPRFGYYEMDADDHWRCLGYYPVILAALESVTDELVALHRTYVTIDGQKAPVPKPKKMLVCAEVKARGSLVGSAVRLFPAQRTLGTVEGIENGCAVTLATGMPVWPATSWALLAGIRLPARVREVYTWVDRDPARLQRDGSYRSPGPDAGRKLNARLREEGRAAHLQLPPRLAGREKVDWLDVYLERGSAGFPRIETRRRPLPSALGLWRRLTPPLRRG